MMRPSPIVARLTAALGIGLAASVGLAHDEPAPAQPEVVITPTRVAGNVYMLTGQGGNMGLTVGPDGAFLIDDQFAPLTDKILAAVRTLTPEPVRFVVNTHWHGDHTGGNENLGKAGVIIVAHENVRTRMSTDQFVEGLSMEAPAAPPKALPVITFTDSVTFHWNGDDLRVVHVPPAHTDGDAVIHFTKTNVIHAGDIFFNGMYPFIDFSTGGSITGMIRAVDLILAIADDRTKIIPGHGPLGDAASLREYRAMLVAVETSIRDMIERGSSREDVIAARPTRAFDERWGGGFLKPDPWVGIVYEGLVRLRRAPTPRSTP